MPRQLQLTDQFRQSFDELLTSHYGRSAEMVGGFKVYFRDEIIPVLRDDPYAGGSRQEPWPTGPHRPRWEFRKYAFRMLYLTGDPAVGRLMYFVHLDSDRLLLFWIYTHKQFEGRPPDRLMKQKMRDMF